MKDQVQNLRKKGIRAGAFYSGQSLDEKRQIFQQMNEEGEFVLYLSPERVQKEGFKKWIENRKIALFAIDEAHCISQWGHDFREEYAYLSELRKWRPDVPILALTASATPTVLDDVAKQLQIRKAQRKVHGFYRSNLYYQVESCQDDDEKLQYVLEALKHHPQGRIIIYCGTRKITEELCLELKARGIEQVSFYHAGLSTSERNKSQEDYVQGKTRILVATNAFGMGIDQADVRLVIHYQMPANIDSLYQEMGRAGRDGKMSTCLLLYAKKDKGLQSYFIDQSEARKEIKNLRWKNLEALVAYAEGGECRHSEILTYYKDSQRIGECGHCDVCAPQSTLRVPEAIVSAPVFAKVIGSSQNKEKKSNKKSKFDVPLTKEQEYLFNEFKNWRKAKSIEKEIPAFMIFGDKTLREIVLKKPSQISDLTSIYGVGESKLAEYGSEIISILNSYEEMGPTSSTIPVF